jgi:hypothetical protein
LIVVGLGAFHWISGITEIEELGSLDHATIVNVEAGDDAFGEH